MCLSISSVQTNSLQTTRSLLPVGLTQIHRLRPREKTWKCMTSAASHDCRLAGPGIPIYFWQIYATLSSEINDESNRKRPYTSSVPLSFPLLRTHIFTASPEIPPVHLQTCSFHQWMICATLLAFHALRPCTSSHCPFCPAYPFLDFLYAGLARVFE